MTLFRPPTLALLALLVAASPMAPAQDRPWWEILRPEPDGERQGLRAPPPEAAPRVEEQPGNGRREPQEPGDRQPEPPRELLSEDAAVALVRTRHGGRVLRAERGTSGGRVVYQVRVLSPDGRVRDYEVDALTGQIR